MKQDMIDLKRRSLLRKSLFGLTAATAVSAISLQAYADEIVKEAESAEVKDATDVTEAAKTPDAVEAPEVTTAPEVAEAPALPDLSEDDPTAMGLGYKKDTTTVDGTKHAKHNAEQKCENCALYTSKSDDAGVCTLFAGKQVSAIGWCAVYAKKA